MPLDVSIVTPEREVFRGTANFVIARSDSGDIGVLPGHAPFLGALHHARLIVEDDDGQTYFAVHGGFVQVFQDRVTVLTRTAEAAPEVDLARAQAQKEAAEQAIAESDTPENREALLRSANRIKTVAEAGILGVG